MKLSELEIDKDEALWRQENLPAAVQNQIAWTADLDSDLKPNSIFWKVKTGLYNHAYR